MCPQLADYKGHYKPLLASASGARREALEEEMNRGLDTITKMPEPKIQMVDGQGVIESEDVTAARARKREIMSSRKRARETTEETTVGSAPYVAQQGVIAAGYPGYPAYMSAPPGSVLYQIPGMPQLMPQAGLPPAKRKRDDGTDSPQQEGFPQGLPWDASKLLYGSPDPPTGHILATGQQAGSETFYDPSRSPFGLPGGQLFQPPGYSLPFYGWPGYPYPGTPGYVQSPAPGEGFLSAGRAGTTGLYQTFDPSAFGKQFSDASALASDKNPANGFQAGGSGVSQFGQSQPGGFSAMSPFAGFGLASTGVAPAQQFAMAGLQQNMAAQHAFQQQAQQAIQAKQMEQQLREQEEQAAAAVAAVAAAAAFQKSSQPQAPYASSTAMEISNFLAESAPSGQQTPRLSTNSEGGNLSSNLAATLAATLSASDIQTEAKDDLTPQQNLQAFDLEGQERLRQASNGELVGNGGGSGSRGFPFALPNSTRSNISASDQVNAMVDPGMLENSLISQSMATKLLQQQMAATAPAAMFATLPFNKSQSQQLADLAAYPSTAKFFLEQQGFKADGTSPDGFAGSQSSNNAAVTAAAVAAAAQKEATEEFVRKIAAGLPLGAIGGNSRLPSGTIDPQLLVSSGGFASLPLTRPSLTRRLTSTATAAAANNPALLSPPVRPALPRRQTTGQLVDRSVPEGSIVGLAVDPTQFGRLSMPPQSEASLLGGQQGVAGDAMTDSASTFSQDAKQMKSYLESLLAKRAM